MEILKITLAIALIAIPVLIAVILHEIAHGYIAYLKGDRTAKRMGRLSLNPLAHVDLFGTIILPALFFKFTGFLFGYAKPVPINPYNLPDPKRDMALIAAAGPVMNLTIAAFSATLFHLVSYLDAGALETFGGYLNDINQLGSIGATILYALYVSVLINLVLCAVNLIPVPPADGGRIVIGLAPEPFASRYAKIEPYGFFILIFLIFVNPFNVLYIPEMFIKLTITLLLAPL